ncbi:hypothetical protein PMAYCL1PPCAC_24714, partial [Pristionchus mayeri]
WFFVHVGKFLILQCKRGEVTTNYDGLLRFSFTCWHRDCLWLSAVVGLWPKDVVRAGVDFELFGRRFSFLLLCSNNSCGSSRRGRGGGDSTGVSNVRLGSLGRSLHQ